MQREKKKKINRRITRKKCGRPNIVSIASTTTRNRQTQTSRYNIEDLPTGKTLSLKACSQKAWRNIQNELLSTSGTLPNITIFCLQTSMESESTKMESAVVGETWIVKPLEFESLMELIFTPTVHNESRGDLPNHKIQAMDLMMSQLNTSAEYWKFLKNKERTSIFAQALTGLIWDEDYKKNKERFRLKLNITFGFYGDGLVKDDKFENDGARRWSMQSMSPTFRTTDDPLTQLLLQKHPNMEVNNGTAIRTFFSTPGQRFSIAQTGISAKFVIAKTVKQQISTEGLHDYLQHNSLTFVHYGDNPPSEIKIGDVLASTGDIYVSTSPRWKWTEQRSKTVYVLHVVEGGIHCSVIKPPYYAELAILPSDETELLKTAVLPSLRISSAEWKVDDIQVVGRQVVIFCTLHHRSQSLVRLHPAAISVKRGHEGGEAEPAAKQQSTLYKSVGSQTAYREQSGPKALDNSTRG